MSFLRRTACPAVMLLFLACVPFSEADQPNPAVLAAVDLMDATPESCRMMLEIRGPVGRVETMHLADGRFVFDLVSVAWDGPLSRMMPGKSGVREYRYSQLSRNPLVTRFVVDVGDGWSCRHEIAARGVQVVCSGPPILETLRPEANVSDIAVVRGIGLSSPVAGLDAGEIIHRSLEFVPIDMVKDGLPNFGAVRDDWLGQPRGHKGLDIYGDEMVVVAAADGEVVGAGIGKLAGGWVKVRHQNGVETVYVHISDVSIRTGGRVTKGQTIATVDGAVGNAVQPQLHFEVRLDGRAVDPVPFIFESASDGVKRRISLANQRLDILARERATRVQQGVE